MVSILKIKIMKINEQQQLFSVMHRLWHTNLSDDINDYIHCWKAIMEVKGYSFKDWVDLDENEIEICLERFGQDVEKTFREAIHAEYYYNNMQAFVEVCGKFITSKNNIQC